jgi:tetratricopeptide (TPR) repeat protein
LPPPEETAKQRREILAMKLLGGQRKPTPPPGSVSTVTAVQAADTLRQRREAAVQDAERVQANRYLAQGQDALAAKDFAGATNFLRLAMSVAPDDLALQRQCNDGLATAAAALADGYWKQALVEEDQQRWPDAALSFAKVCAGRPNDALACERVAHATIKAEINPRRAVEYARRAVELKPTSVDFRLTLARAYAAAGLDKSAQGELDRILDLSPNDARTKNIVATARSLLTAAKTAAPDAGGTPPAPLGKRPESAWPSTSKKTD